MQFMTVFLVTHLEMDTSMVEGEGTLNKIYIVQSVGWSTGRDGKVLIKV